MSTKLARLKIVALAEELRAEGEVVAARLLFAVAGSLAANSECQLLELTNRFAVDDLKRMDRIEAQAQASLN